MFDIMNVSRQNIITASKMDNIMFRHLVGDGFILKEEILW